MRDRLLAAENVKAIDWRDGALYLLDQRVLPSQENWVACRTVEAVADAIRSMLVRGAPAIGICAAYGLVLAARERIAQGGDWQAAWEEDYALLADTRPTASNLFWALQRMRDRLDRLKKHADPLAVLEAEAIAIHESDREANFVMAQLGVERIRKHQGNAQAILTHGNTGALATGGVGTALGVIRAAFLEGLVEQVYVNETRPWLQGSRLTAWELAGDGIPVTVNADSAGAHILKTKGVTWVIVGADCIAANGDVVSKIGTYQLAVCAMHHGVRFMVVAPSSTLDLMMATGDDVALEARDPGELLEVMGQRLKVDAINPVFDVTPADLIDVIVTEKGVVERPDTAKLARLMCRKRLH
ncbi:methylthioribose-1-phosphate isomerase [Pseudomonas synxantha]|uniref:Methylthioribose-1-phosphate isomerase n=1 Tax=Pseudomonas synxantha TaxID=47883 RepID=A0AAX3IAB6_9PSED|nr:S-methyl-5-thioribose-1-phosphate isomerase [Pseudomonas synxantha]AZE66032.1 Methylthioribose-1-phosphate isomerase [Pseudomonas synxantha]KRP56955.1 methylthioribose-1-phosphate isomerase [Pseudomonas synxantha]MBI6567821.1 S-methyl-5-thioribose-1-phosphate isomerase [Pseudomonas synxantha]MBI6583489.1 S-methyl-5-thioribose-1-phosphate isomerase [Pseudomonas synxantha]MBI6647101.1 S-methyl-5-thioribose-1-phosphate isomerase [Pseudomonas synxantha]